VNCFTSVEELKSGVMFFQQKKRTSWGREILFAAANKIFVTESPLSPACFISPTRDKNTPLGVFLLSLVMAIEESKPFSHISE